MRDIAEPDRSDDATDANDQVGRAGDVPPPADTADVSRPYGAISDRASSSDLIADVTRWPRA